MKRLRKRRVILAILCIFIVILFICITLFSLLSKDRLIFQLNGDDTIALGIYEEYLDFGVVAKWNKQDLSNEVEIDFSSVDVNHLGTYEVVYHLKYDDIEKTLVRTVHVVDNIKPVITLNGPDELIITVGSSYQELGCSVVDNYDEQVKNKIQILNNVNTSEIGIYEVRYVVVDSSGNKGEKIRTVIVQAENEKTQQGKVDLESLLMESNEITSMSFLDDGVYIEGYIKDNNGSFKLKLCRDDNNKCTSYEMQTKNKYYYNGNIKLSHLENGTYSLFVESIKNLRAINKLEMQNRIVRAKLDDKLVTFIYDKNNYIQVKVEDFSYKYDILIDPGHGGTDPGASNDTISEKEFNLVQSLYEKQRYEEHGLKVLLLRDDESYGMVMGDSTWPAVRRKAYALGFYGVVSKITYSNHHNSSDDRSLMGWEIIVPADATFEELQEINQIRESWSQIYPLTENHVRLYTRNYNTGSLFTKENNEIYYFTDYYAVIRLPYQLFHIKNVLYEGSYLSNVDDFNWYYTNGNWKALSEAKIKAYVEALGVKYIEPVLS